MNDFEGISRPDRSKDEFGFCLIETGGKKVGRGVGKAREDADLVGFSSVASDQWTLIKHLDLCRRHVELVQLCVLNL